MNKLLTDIDNGQLEEKLNVKQSIDFVVNAWNSVTISTIKICFRKAGFVFETFENIPTQSAVDNLAENNWQRLSSIRSDLKKYSFQDYVSINTFITTSATITDESIITNIFEARTVDEKEDEEKDDVDEETAVEKPTTADFNKAMSTLMLYLQSRYYDTNQCISQLRSIKSRYEDMQPFVQSSLDSFFK